MALKHVSGIAAGLLLMVLVNPMLAGPPRSREGAEIRGLRDVRFAGMADLSTGIPTIPGHPASANSPTRIPAGFLAERLSQQARARIAIQRNWGRRTLLVSGSGFSVAEVMASTRLCLGGNWTSTGDAWALCEYPDLAPMALMTWSEAAECVSGAAAPLRQLTPTQTQLLRTRGKLQPSELTLLQREALLTTIRGFYVNSQQDAVAPEALQLEGVSLATSDGSTVVAPQELGLIIPNATGLPSTPMINFPFEILNTQPPERPAEAFRIGFSAARVSAPPPERSAEDEALFRRDTRLNALLTTEDTAGSHRLTEAMATVARIAKLELIAGTRLDARLLPPLQPSISARDVLTAIEERCGGRWQPVGQGYALQSNTLVERGAHVGEHWQDRVLAGRLASALGRLATRSRGLLVSNGVLHLNSISTVERQALQEVAAFAFAARDEVLQDALELKGVSLRVLPASPDGKSPRRVELVLPVREGGSQPQRKREAITAPLAGTER